jgi:hypothetical protein
MILLFRQRALLFSWTTRATNAWSKDIPFTVSADVRRWAPILKTWSADLGRKYAAKYWAAYLRNRKWDAMWRTPHHLRGFRAGRLLSSKKLSKTFGLTRTERLYPSSHAASFSRAPTPEQIAILVEFFRTQAFARFGSIISTKTRSGPGSPSVIAIIADTLKRLLHGQVGGRSGSRGGGLRNARSRQASAPCRRWQRRLGTGLQRRLSTVLTRSS